MIVIVHKCVDIRKNITRNQKCLNTEDEKQSIGLYTSALKMG